MQQQITWLLFDLGGVLVENNTFQALQTLLPVAMGAEDLKRKWLMSPSVRAFELGQITAPSFAAQFINEWKIDLSQDAFLEEFSNWPTGLYAGAKELLESLRPRYQLACLSNCNAIHWQKFKTFLPLFDVALSSHLLGQIKPDRDIYLSTLSLLDVKPQQLCFFDDSLPNVERACEIGIQAYQTHGLAELQAVCTR